MTTKNKTILSTQTTTTSTSVSNLASKPVLTNKEQLPEIELTVVHQVHGSKNIIKTSSLHPKNSMSKMSSLKVKRILPTRNFQKI